MLGDVTMTPAGMNSTPGRKVNPAEEDGKGPVMFLLGTIVVGILVLVLAAVLLTRAANEGSPYDTSAPTSVGPAAPGK
jgi:hypothetical protein